MTEIQAITQFPVDYLPCSLMSDFVFLLCLLVAFSSYAVDCPISFYPRSFQKRYYNHRSSFAHRINRHMTSLSMCEKGERSKE